MDIDKIRNIAFKTMGRRKAHLSREKGYIFYHCERVAKLALQLRESLFTDEISKDGIIYVGALFHDVTKGIEPHHLTGAQLIRTLLVNECTQQELDEISEVIQLHNSRNRSELPVHIKIVQDADVLDHFGSLEIWLKFMYSAHQEESVFDAIRHWNSEEHKEYIQNTRQSLNFELSKEIFDKKIDFQTYFSNHFQKECNGNIIT